MAFPSTMRLLPVLGATSLILALSLAGLAPAAAQEMYPGQNVTVNPAAIGQVPYSSPYAGGLLPPGAGSRNLPPVHLRPPKVHKRHSAPAEASAAPETAKPRHIARAPESEVEIPDTTRTAITRAQPARKPAAKPAHERAAKAAPPKPPASNAEAAPAAIPFSFDGDTAPVEQPKQAAQPAPERVAKAVPPPRTTLPKISQPKGLTKQKVVLFDTGSSELSDNSKAQLNDLAFSLKTALANGADHIELIAYAGAPGDKSSAARRLSLKRALAVREALIVDGVPAGRIDVRALGGVKAGDNGATDRVDIFVKA